jgi:hypothetical protein
LFSLLACAARHNDNPQQADFYIKLASQSLKEIYDECTIQAALTFVCVAMYYPFYTPKSKFYYNQAWTLAKSAPLIHPKDQMVKTTIYTCYKLAGCDEPFDIRAAEVEEYFSTTCDSGQEFGHHEALTVQFSRVYAQLCAKLDITDPYKLVMLPMPPICYSKAEKRALLLDIKMLDWMVEDTPYKPMFMYFTLLKMLIEWKSGDSHAAMKYALETISWLLENSDNIIMFYSDVLPLFLLYTFFKESYNSHYSDVTLSLIGIIVQRTSHDPHFDLYKELLHHVAPNYNYNNISINGIFANANTPNNRPHNTMIAANNHSHHSYSHDNANNATTA